MAQWEKLLNTLGFTDSEAKIYLTSLEMGPASVQDIAKRGRVSRVTTYAVIESLAARSLMSSVDKGKKKLFVAESPERLVSFVHGRVKEMEATLHEIQESLHDLKLLQRGEKPVVKLFEGPEALKAIQDDVVQTRPKQIEEFGNSDEIRKLYPRESRADYYKEITRFKPKIRVIYRTSETPGTRQREYPIEEVILPESKFQFFGDVLVYSNKVAFSTFRGKQISVLIESIELADTMRAFFDFAWHCLANPPGVQK